MNTMDNIYRNDCLVRKTYLSFVTVSVLSTLAATIGLLVDNIIAGQLIGPETLGIMGIVSPISLIFSAIGNIFASGGTARAAHALGKGDHREMSGIFSITILFLMICGVLITLPGLIFPEQIAVMLGARDELLPMARDYIFGFFMGALPTLMTTALMGYLKIDGSPRLPLVAIVVMTVMNIILDIIMVVVFELGMFGMALATSLSYVAAVAVACTHFLRPVSSLRLVKPSGIPKELSAMLITGAPTAANRIFDTVKTVVLNIMLISLVSSGAVAVLNIRNQANNFLGAITMGMGTAILPVAGMFYGEGDRTALKDTLKSAIRLGVTANSIIAVLIILFPEALPSLLGIEGADTLQMASAAMIMFAVSMPLRALNMAFINFYQATKKPVLSLVLCSLQSLIYTLAASVILIFPMDSDGVWLAFVLGEALTIITLAVIIAIRNKRFPRSFDDLMMLDKSTEKDRNKLEFSTDGSIDEIKYISDQLYDFCLTYMSDEKSAKDLSACVEEICSDIVKHSFTNGRRQWLDITFINQNNEITIRFRDNGKPFDHMKQITSVNTDDGILRIKESAKSISYKRSIGLNSLSLTL
ncbi:MAG: hypothetical protein E7478_02580 [Ruminococcaceae bacterium]|nr:hypothetical protein [Oscillospiraceae bacterium]MBE6901336.1 hypothetical protein [Oscillospiraceae bacterium]